MKFELLENIANIRTGKYDANHATIDGKYKFYTCAFEQFKSPTYSFEGEALVLPGNGANVGEVFFNDGEKFEAYQRTYVVENIKAFPKYLFMYFKCFWKESLRNTQYGSATNYIRMDNLTKFKIPLPPLSDQIRIAEILTQAETLIAERKKCIGLLDEYLKSVFLEMFGNPVRNEKGWEISNIGSQCIVRGGKRIPKGSKLIKENTGYPYIKAGNIKDGKVTTKDLEYLTPDLRDKLKRYIVEDGDVCITVVGINIGDIGIVPSDLHLANLTENANKLLIKDRKKLNNVYLAFYLRMDFVQNSFNINIRAAGVPKLALFRIEQVELLLPPINLQKKFGELVEKTESIKMEYQKSLVELENLYGVLSQKVFRREIIKNAKVLI